MFDAPCCPRSLLCKMTMLSFWACVSWGPRTKSLIGITNSPASSWANVRPQSRITDAHQCTIIFELLGVERSSYKHMNCRCWETVYIHALNNRYLSCLENRCYITFTNAHQCLFLEMLWELIYNKTRWHDHDHGPLRTDNKSHQTEFQTIVEWCWSECLFLVLFLSFHFRITREISLGNVRTRHIPPYQPVSLNK